MIQGRFRSRIRAALTSAAVLLPALAMTATTPITASASNTRNISAAGSASLVSAPAGMDGLSNPEFMGGRADGGAAPYTGSIVDRSRSAGARVSGAGGSGSASGGDSKLTRSFNGLNLRDQRLANGGNQFTVEPPDQGLCAGNGFILESVNTVLRVYATDGTPLTGVVDLNTFYGYPAQFNRTTGDIGPFLTDPICLFDSQTQRWFQIVLTLDQNTAGDFTGVNHLDIAVSNTPSPLGGWTIFKIDTTNDGTNGTPNHQCKTGPHPPAANGHPQACFADFPHVGADANGLYITTNEYEFFGPDFVSADIYALSKTKLAAAHATGVSPAVTLLTTVGADHGNPGFTVWPAVSPSPGDFATGLGGTEYFMSSNAAGEANGTGASTDLLTWSLTNTSSLNSSTPHLSLSHRTLQVAMYGVPPPAEQKAGDWPLGQCINDTTHPTPRGPGCWRYLFAHEPAHNEVLAHLDSSDTRMLTVQYANGTIWGALDTALTIGGVNQAAVEWFTVDPKVHGSGVSYSLHKNGYLGLDRNNVIYPAIAVTEGGNAVMAFTVVGKDHYPSAGYAPMDTDGVGAISIAAEGLGPQDGFTGYKAEVGSPPRPRWGDYGGAVAVGDSVFIASEYTGQTCTLDQYMTNTVASPLFSCGKTRVTLGNWYTRISQISGG
jgi:hypothetical protein